MQHSSANPNGPATLELVAALTSEQWTQLTQFAAHRLRQTARTPERQRALAQFCPQSLVHAAVEKFARGDAGRPGGRRLKAAERVNPAAFVGALQSAMNSLVSDACRRAEARQEHLPVATGGEEPYTVEADNDDFEKILTLRDIEAVLFGELQTQAGADAERQAAIDCLRENCVTGHFSSDHGVNHKVMHAVRRQAQQLWLKLHA